MLKRLLGPLVLLLVVAACTPTAPPSISVTVSPADDTVDVPVTVVITALFSAAMNESTLDDAFVLSSPTGGVDGVLAYDADLRRASFTPSAPLIYGTEYTATLAGTVRSAVGGRLPISGDYSWSFVTEAEDTAPAVTAVEVSPASVDLEVGDTQQFSATVTAVGGADETVSWSSSNEAVATVDPTGLVTAVGAGSTTISATSDFTPTVSGSASLEVTAPTPAVTAIEVSPSPAAVLVGETVELTAVVTAVGGADETVIWTSSDDAVATVDATGLVTGVSVGSAVITATSDFDDTVSGNTTVQVSDSPVVISVTVDPTSADLIVGETQQFSAIVAAAGGADETVVWTTSDEDVATVNAASGLVTAVGQGAATITATSNFNDTVSGSATVNVDVPPAVTDVTVTPSTADLTVGGTQQFTGTVTAEGGAPTTVTWTSSDEDVALVDAAGLVTAIGVGSATITATSTFALGISDDATVNVSLPEPDLDDIYVDGSADAGGNGHVDFPFQTITEGIDAVNAGGTVNVAAGDYEEGLYITKSLDLIGAGTASTFIVVDSDAPDPFSESAIDIVGVDGFRLSGFTVETVAPGPAVAAITVRGGSADISLDDLVIAHTNAGASTHGINILLSSDVTVQDVVITPTTVGDHIGTGVRVSGELGTVTGVTIANVTTALHEEFSGLTLDPRDAMLSDISIQGTFNEVNKLNILYDGIGTVSDLTAPQFVVAVGNIDPYYGSGNWFFYKESVDRAIIDSIFNFTQNYAWIHSTIQMLDVVDQSIRLNHFVLGEVFDDLYGWGITRSHRIQAAVDAAEPGALLEIRAGTYGDVDEPLVPGSSPQPGNVVIDVDGLIIEGVGAATVISAGIGTVLTVDADAVTIQGVQVQGPAGVTGINVASGATHTIAGNNLLTPIALVNVASTVDATNNWWGAADGPSGDALPPGGGGQLLDGGGGVTYIPFAITPF